MRAPVRGVPSSVVGRVALDLLIVLEFDLDHRAVRREGGDLAGHLRTDPKGALELRERGLGVDRLTSSLQRDRGRRRSSTGTGGAAFFGALTAFAAFFTPSS